MILDDPLLRKDVEALSMLLDYVDGRPDDATADDDVRAMEQVAAILHALPVGEALRLRGLIEERLGEALGLGET